MRRFWGSWGYLCCLAVGPLVASEAEPSWPEALHEDANLFDVCFVDPQHGWAVGDRSTILHTEDGGQSWHAQSCPVACRLESVQFHDTRRGWAAGGYTSAYTHRPIGVILKTEDGGKTWQQVSGQFLPWLRQIQFLDLQQGYALGLPSSMSPSAVYHTRDGGQHWTPWPGESVGWVDAHFSAQGSGLLIDRRGQLAVAEPAKLRWLTTPPHLHQPTQIYFNSARQGLLCGSQGSVHVTEDAGQSWQKPRQLPDPQDLAEFDWLALDGIDQRYWIVGVPGSRVLHTADGGRTWKWTDTGHPLPLFGLDFVDADHGWAVGALGAVLRTADGGRTWSCLRGRGRRLAVLGVYGHASQIPWTLWTQLCAAEGGFGAVEVLSATRVGGEEPGQVPLSSRLHEAMAALGGAAANLLQALPAPDLDCSMPSDKIRADWDQSLGTDSSQQLTEYLVRQLRLWRPELVILADPAAKNSGLTEATQRIVLRAVQEAANPQQYVAQIRGAGLAPWRVPRVGTQTQDFSEANYRAIASRQVLAWGQSIGSISRRASSVILDDFPVAPDQVGLLVAGGPPSAGTRVASSQPSIHVVDSQETTHRLADRLPDNVQRLHEQFQHRRTIEALFESADGIPVTRRAQIARLQQNACRHPTGERCSTKRRCSGLPREKQIYPGNC